MKPKCSLTPFYTFTFKEEKIIEKMFMIFYFILFIKFEHSENGKKERAFCIEYLIIMCSYV